ncbi:MAG: hypothetical protein ACOCY6_04540 [Halodesulfurarchaeum sp.]
MNELLEYLDTHSRTLTIYDYTGSSDHLQELAQWLGSYGIDVVTAATADGSLDHVAVLDEGETVLGAAAGEELLSRLSFESAIEDGEEPPVPELVESLSADVTVQPSRSVEEMLRVSRDFERRALRAGSGELHAGFQKLSKIADSKRTMDIYRAPAEEGVDVRVYGYPDADLEAVPFTVVEDAQRELEKHWFLLYDGGANPQRKAALVSAERPEEQAAASDPGGEATNPSGVYDSFFTTDPETVEDLFALDERITPS